MSLHKLVHICKLQFLPLPTGGKELGRLLELTGILLGSLLISPSAEVGSVLGLSPIHSLSPCSVSPRCLLSALQVSP